MIPLNNGGSDINKKLNALLAILQFSINSEAFLEIHLQTMDSTTRMEQSSKKLVFSSYVFLVAVVFPPKLESFPG